MTTTNPSPTISNIVCIACQSSNAGDAAFCQSCGHALFDSCEGCGKPSVLGQAFCGGCGHDLKKTVADQKEKYKAWLAEAIELTKQLDFEKAKRLLLRVAEVDDYRFREFADSAKTAIEKVRWISEQKAGNVESVVREAKSASEDGDQSRVIKLLGNLPEKLLGKEAKGLLNAANTFHSQLSQLKSETQAALKDKNWLLAGPLLDQLLNLVPDNPDYLRLSSSVAKKLIAQAQTFGSAHEYDDALLMLDSVPQSAVNETLHAFRRKIENLQWISNQFDSAPFATPMLGRLAVRWTKDAPDDSQAQQWVGRLAKELKESPRKPGNIFPGLSVDTQSWCGGSLEFLGLPTCVADLDHNDLRGSGGRMNVAIGLALQGLGQGRVQDQFAPKKGLLSGLSRRKRKSVWGIDIGASGVRAVCLQLDEDQPKLIDCFVDEFDSPTCRTGSESKMTEVIGASLKRFLNEKETDSSLIWVNFPSKHLLSRFLKLPPLSDKEAIPHLDREIKQLLPVELDELAMLRWIAPLNTESQLGRASMIVATKKHNVESRLELLKSFGLDVDGMQADPLALLNLVDCEFGEILGLMTENEDEENKSDSAKKAIGDDKDSIALVDCGAETTTLIFVAADAFWFWTIESGGEDLTSTLAKSTKTTHDNAEKLKRNVADVQFPVPEYETMERRFGEIRSRMSLLHSDAKNQNDRFNIVATWCSGGGVLAHGYMQHVLLGEIPTDNET